MKQVGVVKLLIIFLASDGIVTSSDGSLTANLNDLIDQITENIHKNGAEVGLDIIEVPPIHNVNGETVIDLTNGTLKNVISIQRYRNTQISYDNGVLNARLGFQFIALEADFAFNLKFLGLNPEGNLTAVITHLAAEIDVTIDALNTNVTLSELLVPNVGDVILNVKSKQPIYEKVAKAMVAFMTTFFQDEVVYIIATIIRDKFNEILWHLLDI